MINSIRFYYRTDFGNKLVKFFFYYLFLLAILIILYYSSFEHPYYRINKYYGKCLIKEINGNYPNIRIKGVFNDVYNFDEVMINHFPYIGYSSIVNCYNFKGLIIIEKLSQKVYNHYIGFWIYTILSIELYIIIQIIFGVMIVNEILNY